MAKLKKDIDYTQNDFMTHLICYSGGHSSARVAMNVAKKYPNDKIILLNHNINSEVEDMDIQRFKEEVADKLNLEITYANYKGILDKDKIPDQFDTSLELKGFKFGNGTELCTYTLKTEPFHKWLDENFPVKKERGCLPERRDDLIIYYGFDLEEKNRVQRRSQILGSKGYRTDYPLALWKDADHTIVVDAGIRPPLTYKDLKGINVKSVDYKGQGAWKHANCVGCLKAGKQHWYVVYCVRPDVWEKAKATEEIIDHSIIRNNYLEDLEEDFEKLKQLGLEPTENIDGRTFWATARKMLKKSIESDEDLKPCECTI